MHLIFARNSYDDDAAYYTDARPRETGNQISAPTLFPRFRLPNFKAAGGQLDLRHDATASYG